jgi:hypothetical protein
LYFLCKSVALSINLDIFPALSAIFAAVIKRLAPPVNAAVGSSEIAS